MPNAISIVLVDDNAVSREAVANLITQQPGFRVLVATGDRQDALMKVLEAKAHALLVDATLNDYGSLRLTLTVHNKQPETKIIVTGVRPHQHDVTGFVRAGASGFIMKDASVTEFLESIRVVTAGGHALPRRLTGAFFDEIAHGRRGRRHNGLRAMALTNRERQVLALIGEGLGNKEISRRLDVAVDTVRSHVASLFKKTGVRTRLEVAALARADSERHSHSGNHGDAHRE